GQEQVEHRLVDAHVERAELDLHPVVEPELVLRLVLVVAPGAAEAGAQDDRERKDHHAAEGDLLARAQVLEPGHSGFRSCFGGCVNGRSAIVIEKWRVKTARNSTAAPSPALLFESPTAMMIPATSQPRPTMLPASRPTLVRGSSDAAARRTASSLTSRWAIHAPAPVSQPAIGNPAARN